MTTNFQVPPPPPSAEGEDLYHQYFTQLEALIRRHRELGAEVAALTEERKAIQAQVSGLTKPGWKMVVDGVAASHREANRAYSEVVALTVLDADAKKRCVDKLPRFDPKLVRAEVEAAGKLEECMVVDPEKSSVVKLS